MTEMNKFLLIAQTQNEVNKKMIGADDWVAEAKNPDRGINYTNAILDEAVEFLRSAIPFKWWAKNSLDVDNAVVELVDILHFQTSLGILLTGSVEKCAEDMELGFLAASDSELEQGATVTDALRTFIHTLTSHEIDTQELWVDFWTLAKYNGTNLETIISMYRSKAVLNKFRTKMGYGLGTYRKTWLEGKEDNWYLTNYLKDVMNSNGGMYPGDEVLDNFLHSNYR